MLHLKIHPHRYHLTIISYFTTRSRLNGLCFRDSSAKIIYPESQDKLEDESLYDSENIFAIQNINKFNFI